MTKTLTLRSFDVPGLHRFAVGFDEMLDELNSINTRQIDNYPPYNVVQVNEDEYEISLAVAGFKPSDLSVTKDKNHLVITGEIIESLDELEKEVTYLHRGIGGRSFRREFKLAEHVEIVGANLEHGILTVQLKREIPEALQPKKIAITYNK